MAEKQAEPSVKEADIANYEANKVSIIISTFWEQTT